MNKIVGILLILVLPTTVLSQTYMGIGGGSASGDGWSGNAPEVLIGHSLKSGWQLEVGIHDLGSRRSWRDEAANGVALEGGYSFSNEIGYLNLGGGIYVYDADYRTGDAYYSEVGTAPILSASSGYVLSKNLSVRLKYSQYFLDNDFGSPNRLSAAVIYSF